MAQAQPAAPACKLAFDVNSVYAVSTYEYGRERRYPISISEHALINSIANTGMVFRNPKYWEFFETDLNRVDREINRIYSQDIDSASFAHLLTIANRLGRYRALLLDPGIAQRMDDFLSFVEKTLPLHPGISSFDLRERFSTSLSKIIIWHGGLLSTPELEVVKRKGILANVFFEKNKTQLSEVVIFELLGYLAPMDRPRAKSPASDMSGRLAGRNDSSLYSSHSDFIEVTYAGAYKAALNSSRTAWEPIRPGKFSLFKIEISPLNVVRGDGIFWKLRQGADTSHERSYKTTGLNGETFIRSFKDPAFEFFVQYVAPHEIIDVIQYDNMPPRWSW